MPNRLLFFLENGPCPPARGRTAQATSRHAGLGCAKGHLANRECYIEADAARIMAGYRPDRKRTKVRIEVRPIWVHGFMRTSPSSGSNVASRTMCDAS
jgi:hypothetical protein